MMKKEDLLRQLEQNQKQRSESADQQREQLEKQELEQIIAEMRQSVGYIIKEDEEVKEGEKVKKVEIEQEDGEVIEVDFVPGNIEKQVNQMCPREQYTEAA
jgi:hypothetical protein